jgi:prepilin-type N-terminal cleavage/methylation domain-containing protein
MNSNRHSRKENSRGFTLIELLTVIAIIGILAAIIIPTVGSVRKSASSAKALSNVKQIGLSNLLYSQENRGKLLGEGVDWRDTNDLWNNTATYISKSPGNTNADKTKLNAIVGSLVDPLVPADLQRYGGSPTDSFLVTWSTNTIFNIRKGRENQGLTDTRPDSGFPNYTRRRLLSEFSEPSRVIYMVSGNYQFDRTHAANPALLVPPTVDRAGYRIWYYHGSGKKTPGVFLDGHTEMLAYPIDPKRINPTAL